MWHPNGVVPVLINRFYLRGCKPIDLVCRPFNIVLNLHGGQNVTQLLIGYLAIVLMFIFQFILHGFRDSALIVATRVTSSLNYFLGCSNLNAQTLHPSLKVEVIIWLSHASHGRDQCTVYFWPWKVSLFHCEYIWCGIGRCSGDSSTCSSPTQTKYLSQSHCTYLAPNKYRLIHIERQFLSKSIIVPWWHPSLIPVPTDTQLSLLLTPFILRRNVCIS